MKTSKFVTDLFMGPDGKTWAIGRIYSLPMFLTGISVPLIALLQGQQVSLSEVGLGFTGLGGAVMLLVAGTNHVDNPLPLGTSAV